MLYAIPNHILSMSEGIDIGTTYMEILGLKGKFAFMTTICAILFVVIIYLILKKVLI